MKSALDKSLEETFSKMAAENKSLDIVIPACIFKKSL